MDTEEIKNKYDDLTNKGKLPLVFKALNIEDPKTNHELMAQSHFNSSKFNNRELKVRYTDRVLMP